MVAPGGIEEPGTRGSKATATGVPTICSPALVMSRVQAMLAAPDTGPTSIRHNESAIPAVRPGLAWAILSTMAIFHEIHHLFQFII